MESKRLNYLDNIKWITVVLVVIYHIIYLFNNSGVISNINVKGIPIMDSFLIFVYSWFMCLLFVGSILIVLIRKIDKKDKIGRVCEKINLPILFSLVFIVWGSSFILNTPLITVYRFGIYLFMMLLGYYVFSNQELIKKLEKVYIPLSIISIFIGITYVITYYGVNYADNSVLNDLFTNVYLWIAILSILGTGSKCLNFKNKFTEYMTKNNFNIYILHYIVVLLLGYVTVTFLHLPFILNYIIILLGTIILLPVLIEIVKRIPIIRFMVLGISKARYRK